MGLTGRRAIKGISGRSEVRKRIRGGREHSKGSLKSKVIKGTKDESFKGLQRVGR